MPVPVKRALFRKFRQSAIRHHELNYLFWECTTRCNLNCLHCGSDCSKAGAYPDMPLADFLSALDTISNPAPNFTVVMTGGEPLLRNDIELCGKEIRRRGMRWSLVSNGMLYDEERHISLLNAGLGALTLSLDGPQHSHIWLRNSPDSFGRVMHAIELASGAARLNFDVVTCVNKRNIGELDQIMDILVHKGVRAWRLFTITPIGRAENNPELHLSDDQLLTLMEFICTSREEKRIDVKFSCEGYVGQYEWKVRDAGFFCRAGINIGSILADGSISACPNVDRAFSQGTIYEDNFYEVWQRKYEPFRDRTWARRGQCADCSHFRDCLGNGLHNWQAEPIRLRVCHNEKLELALLKRNVV